MNTKKAKYVLYNGSIGKKHHFIATQAIKDVTTLANELGYTGLKRISFKIKGVSSLFDLLLALKMLLIPSGSVVIYQNPMHFSNLLHKIMLSVINYKKIKLIFFIHDLNMFRGVTEAISQENELMEYASVIVSHNKKMTERLIEIGCSEEKIINLEIFDYLYENTSINKEKAISTKSIVVAGNLSSEKCGFLYQLINNNIKLDLYGVNLSVDHLNDNVCYHGAFPAEILPDILSGGFGLVWDGYSVDACDKGGKMGEYLKYNNPHKFSLYLAAGIPVIVWKGSALAAFVEKNGVGITINSLKDLDMVLSQMTESVYEAILDKIKPVQKKITSGGFTVEAINKAESLI